MASKILSLLDRRVKVQKRIYCISLRSYFTLRCASLKHLLGRWSCYVPISTFMQDKGIVLLNCSITSALPCQISITLARGIFVLNDLVRSHWPYSSLTVLSRRAQASDYREPGSHCQDQKAAACSLLVAQGGGNGCWQSRIMRC